MSRKPDHRLQRGWRQDLFDGLPTDLQRTVDTHIDNTLALRISEIEGMKVTEGETKKFLEVMRSPAMPGAYLFTWKRIPIVKVIRQGIAVRIDELRGVGPKPMG